MRTVSHPSETPSSGVLDSQVCFALYSASRAVTSAYRDVLGPLGLTYPQYLVLLLLWEKDSRSVHEIATRLRLDSGTLSPLLKRMEAKGLVHRERSAQDERKVTVRLSSSGADLESHREAIQGHLFSTVGLTPDKLALLRELATHVALTCSSSDHQSQSE